MKCKCGGIIKWMGLDENNKYHSQCGTCKEKYFLPDDVKIVELEK